MPPLDDLVRCIRNFNVGVGTHLLTRDIWPDGSNLTPNIVWCSVTPPAVCFTVLLIGKVIDHTWALYQTFLNLSYFYFFGEKVLIYGLWCKSNY